MLFLTNKKTGKEVVTQVLRKRAFRPTNCYVDLEFTEDCPGFWGIEFPKAAAPTKESIAEASKNLGDEPEPATNSSGPPAQNLAAPSVQDVDQLKGEVAQLQAQLKSLPQATPSAAPGAASATKAAAKISAEIANEEQEQRFAELLALEAKQGSVESAQAPGRLPRKSTKKLPLKTSAEKLMVPAAAVVVLPPLALINSACSMHSPRSRLPPSLPSARQLQLETLWRFPLQSLRNQPPPISSRGSALDTSPTAHSAPTIPAPEENSSSIQPSSSVATNKAETNALSATGSSLPYPHQPIRIFVKFRRRRILLPATRSQPPLQALAPRERPVTKIPVRLRRPLPYRLPVTPQQKSSRAPQHLHWITLLRNCSRP